MLLEKGRYRARLAAAAADLDRAQRLRHEAFIARRKGATPRADGRDADAFDPLCRHVLVEDAGSDALVACYRLQDFDSGAQIGRSYSAQFYGLGALAAFPGRMVEMGRFCIAPGLHDPDILRMAWGAMTRIVDAEGVALLFGCSSFYGTDPDRYADSLGLLAARHLAPDRWRPTVKAPVTVPYAARLAGRAIDGKEAMQRMPPLLRSYLMLGGWVSDHAVVDPDLNTLHVFTGLEIAAIPDSRKRLLRADAG